jgi:hypothetical protein
LLVKIHSHNTPFREEKFDLKVVCVPYWQANAVSWFAVGFIAVDFVVWAASQLHAPRTFLGPTSMQHDQLLVCGHFADASGPETTHMIFVIYSKQPYAERGLYLAH